MQTQTIFKAGNSNVVAIPKALLKDLGIKKGQKVYVDKTPDGTALVVKPAEKRAKKATTREFEKWINKVLEEDAKILDELAIR